MSGLPDVYPSMGIDHRDHESRPHSCGISVHSLGVVKPLFIHQFETTLFGFGYRDDCANAKPLDVVQLPSPSLLHFGWIELDSVLGTEDALLVLHRQRLVATHSWLRRDTQEMRHTAPSRALRKRCVVVWSRALPPPPPCMGSMTAELLIVPSMALTSSWCTNGAGPPASVGTSGAMLPASSTPAGDARRAGLCHPDSRLFQLRDGRILLHQQHFKRCTSACPLHAGQPLVPRLIWGDVHAAHQRHPHRIDHWSRSPWRPASLASTAPFPGGATLTCIGLTPALVPM